MAPGRSDTALEFISLTVAGHAFCIDIGSVREIRGWTAATPLPQAPDFVLGVINLRGAVMPVLDLAARLGLGRTELTGRHVIVVIQCADAVAGLVVEAVQETLMVKAEELQPPPRFPDEGRPYVDALIPRSGSILGRLSVEALMPEEPIAVQAA